jgi:hypothetical protein
VEEDEEMERENEGGIAKRPDPNELGVLAWGELALDQQDGGWGHPADCVGRITLLVCKSQSDVR